MLIFVLLQQFIVSASIAAAPLQAPNFAEKCAQSGVIACYGFDAQTDLAYVFSQNTNPCTTDPVVQPNHYLSSARVPGEGNTVATIQNGVCVYPIVDGTQKHSGAGSLKFTIPSTSSDNTSGNFTLPFKGLGTAYYTKAGETVYFQWWQFFTDTFLGTKYLPGGGWKQVILYGNPPNGSNSSGIEFTWVNGYLRGLPVMYGQQGVDDYGYQDVRGCVYPGPYTEPPCVRYKAGWHEFTTAITPGTVSCYGGNPAPGNTRVQAWVDGQLIIDNPHACMNLSGTDGNGPGQFVLTPFQTGKDSTQVTPVAYTWYDDVVISTQPIAMTGTSVVPPTDPCITAPLKPPTGLKWPSARSGNRSVTWNSGTNEIVRADYQWPLNGAQSIEFTDRRGCKVIVRK